MICLDNFFSGRKENIAHLVGHPRFELIRHDIVDPIKVECDQIYNLACPASPVPTSTNPIKTIKTSTIGMINVWAWPSAAKARILHTSTSEVYGDPEVHPQREDYWGHVTRSARRSCYDEGKTRRRIAVHELPPGHGVGCADHADLSTPMARRWDPNDGRVVSNFIMQALRGEPITCYGDGKQTRSLCYVSDNIDGMMKLMDQDQTIGPVNIGNPVENTMIELAQAVLELTGSKSKLINVDLPKDDPKQRCQDITKAKAI